MDRYAVGIDTGGTFTDGVLLDYRSRKVLASAKTFTTRHDLKVGVVNAVKKLHIKETHKVKIVGISSTLATNSIAEGKARKVGLILIGYDKDLIESYGLKDKFSTDTIAYFKGGHNSQGAEKTPLDIAGIKKWVKKNKDNIDAFAVSSYFSPLNSKHEDRAFKAIQKISNLPVVMGHQLSTHLDSIKRAATASLNASLVAVMHEFIDAVQMSLNDLGIKAPLMIVRGDGTLMPCSEAVQKPVETVLSGPAASAIGGDFLTNTHSSLVIDMGSTTTDMALIDNGRVVVSQEGARVGNTETSIEAAKIRTLCIGCDSLIRINKFNELFIGPEKVVPISQMAHRYEDVKNNITNLKNKPETTWKESDLEYWNLYKKDLNNHKGEELSNAGKKVFEILKDGPKSLTYLMKANKVYHPSQLDRDKLVRQGIIEVSSITPSDILHASDNMELWEQDVARQAIRTLCRIHDRDRHRFIKECLNKIIHTIVEEIIIFLACQNMKSSNMPANIDGKWGAWIINEMFTDKSPYLSINIDSRFPITGTGAPAEYFIKNAAEILSAPFILPQHYNVANAVGAVSGSIMEIREARVFMQEKEGARSFIVQQAEKTKKFDDFENASDYAENICKKTAFDSLIEAGAKDPHIEIKKSVEGSIHRITARAIGNPKLSDQ